MQEAPSSYEKDEQQERGNYDSANYMENADGGKVILVGSSPTFSDSSSYVGLTLTNKQVGLCLLPTVSSWKPR